MNPRNLFFAVAAVIVMGASFALMSQGLTDGVKVTLPYSVTIGDVVLDPVLISCPTPANSNAEGIKGAGEVGTVAAPAAIASAVEAALRQKNPAIEIRELPIRPGRTQA